jgi:hypothetical protein
MVGTGWFHGGTAGIDFLGFLGNWLYHSHISFFHSTRHLSPMSEPYEIASLYDDISSPTLPPSFHDDHHANNHDHVPISLLGGADRGDQCLQAQKFCDWWNR